MGTSRGKGRGWVQFSYTARAYERPAGELQKHWGRLHRGDAERWPDAQRVASLHARTAAAPAAVATARAAGDAAALAAAVQQTWRAFHRGDFEAAWTQGATQGPLGIAAAVKACGAYVTYLEEDRAAGERLLHEAVELAERAAAACPEHANSHYFHAYALGRYSQRISIVKALAAGHARRIRQSLERALALEPKHADAHVALGVYHAEIVAKVGALAAKLSYGASAAAAEQHFEKALALFPESPIAALEFGNALLALHGEARRARAVELYERAAAATPMDAMERLDVEQAKAELA